MAAAEAAMGNVNELQRSTRARTRAASAATTRAAAAAADAAVTTVSMEPSEQQQCQHVEHWLGAQRFNDGKLEVKTKHTKQTQQKQG